MNINLTFYDALVFKYAKVEETEKAKSQRYSPVSNGDGVYHEIFHIFSIDVHLIVLLQELLKNFSIECDDEASFFFSVQVSVFSSKFYVQIFNHLFSLSLDLSKNLLFCSQCFELRCIKFFAE